VPERRTGADLRVRDHIFLSTAGSALLAPRLRRQVVGLWAGGVLIDADHYLWFCVRRRNVSPRAAVRFFNEAHPPQTSTTRLLHHPTAVLAMLALATVKATLRTFAMGMTAHVALDACYEARMRKARVEALARDRYLCQACGTQTQRIEAHVFRQPRLLPDYRARNLVSLCGPCHELAHSPLHEMPRWS
jgi:hypothetical protein